MRRAEYPPPEKVLVHLSDTHLRSPGDRLFGDVDPAEGLELALSRIQDSGLRPDGIIVTGDLADLGEPEAYARLRELIDPVAERVGAPVLWVMGNHDERRAFREALWDGVALSDAAALLPVDRVDELDGLRIVTLDTSVPGAHHGEITPEQHAWLEGVLATPAPLGTILAMHHPPVPSILPLAASVELRDQGRLARTLAGSDVRAIIAGHLHYSTFATFAGIPVSVASSTCYAQDLTVPVGGTRPQDAAQGYNLVHVYADTVVHSVVAADAGQTLEDITPDEARARLQDAGVLPHDGSTDAVRSGPPTTPVTIAR